MPGEPNIVGAELDGYGMQYAGVDSVAHIRRLGRRCMLLHLKDMAAGEERCFAEVGEGVMDMDGIVAAGQEVGVQDCIVEQDKAYHRTPLEAIAQSMENIKARGWA
jgi:sugar phosphate isomerase/epimerase